MENTEFCQQDLYDIMKALESFNQRQCQGLMQNALSKDQNRTLSRQLGQSEIWKLQPWDDIGNFHWLCTEARKGYRISTNEQKIMEKYSVQFDECTEQMALSTPVRTAPNLLTPGPISSRVVTQSALALLYVHPQNKELEIPSVSISIDLDAPSGSHISSPLDHHSSSVTSNQPIHLILNEHIRKWTLILIILINIIGNPSFYGIHSVYKLATDCLWMFTIPYSSKSRTEKSSNLQLLKTAGFSLQEKSMEFDRNGCARYQSRPLKHLEAVNGSITWNLQWNHQYGSLVSEKSSAIATYSIRRRQYHCGCKGHSLKYIWQLLSFPLGEKLSAGHQRSKLVRPSHLQRLNTSRCLVAVPKSYVDVLSAIIMIMASLTIRIPLYM
ncbi:hypothetical protein Tco_0951137 [Tanacetum coccineum]|uniref:Uncharacterized protein n=1 Tax=Tanacetum coccineum TaxID=301880 RepID=A0ABQ5DVN2_9ASTR